MEWNNSELTPIFEKASEGGYIAYIRELPGANSQGETLEEAQSNLKDAMALLLECLAGSQDNE